MVNNRFCKLMYIALLGMVLVSYVLPSQAVAGELSGSIAVEGSYFLSDPLHADQEKDNASLAIQPEYYHEFGNGSGFVITPFARFDTGDSERTHYDLRELNYIYLADNWEARIGIGKVFWGVTESVHLVDIINQTDLIESFDGEEKLGQPMVSVSYPSDFGTIDLFVLPYFRERTFPGKGGRFRANPHIDIDNATYESSDEDRHIDFAGRYSHSIGDWDIGISHFYGTSREPTITPVFTGAGSFTLVPHYELINQTGADIQLITGEWLWKLEAIYRTGQGDPYFMSAVGFEYALVGLLGTSWDLGLLTEWIYDDRQELSPTPFDNDIMVGARLAVNDLAGSEMLIGWINDVERSSSILILEGSRRISNSVKASLEAGMFSDIETDDVFYAFRDDDYARLEIAYYF